MTIQQVQESFDRLRNAVGKESGNGPGDWKLFGGRSGGWVIMERTENGYEFPFGDKFRNAADFCEVTDFAVTACDLTATGMEIVDAARDDNEFRSESAPEPEAVPRGKKA